MPFVDGALLARRSIGILGALSTTSRGAGIMWLKGPATIAATIRP